MAVGDAMEWRPVPGLIAPFRPSLGPEDFYGHCQCCRMDHPVAGSPEIVLHYLYDFLLIGSPASGECRNGMEVLLASFHQLGLPVATEKTEGPAPRLTFLGFEIDSVAMEIRLPHAKLVALKGAVEAWRGRGSCKKKDLESLAGKLVWACKAVSPGKTFVRCMFELLAVVKKSHHHVQLNVAFRSDLLWWDTFLQDWNGVPLLRQDAGRTTSFGRMHRGVSDVGPYGHLIGSSSNGRRLTMWAASP